MKASQLATTPGVSSSFAADLRFTSGAAIVDVPRLSVRLREPKSLILQSSATAPVDAILCVPSAQAPVHLSLGRVGVIPLLALFLPHFRVEGKNYAGSQRSAGSPDVKDSSKLARDAGVTVPRGGSTTGILISKWDALWPLLQPPLNFTFPESLDLPSDLRPYQIEGVRFLADAESGLLGDDMGTGKTVQAVVALRLLVQKGKVRRALVVCPLAVLSSWEDHVLNWGRVLTCVTIRGARGERRAQWRTPAHAYLTTYDIIREDAERLTGSEEPPEFDLIIADEIQKIKNTAAATTKAMRSLVAARRWGLSATPFENRLEELVSVFSFLKPRLLLPDRETAQSIRSKIAPFFLRRTKEVLRDELPDKVHEAVWLELGEGQRRAYQLAEQQGIVELEKHGERVTVSHVLALLQKLKQICNFEPRTGESVKLETLRERLEEVSEQGSKALVFTQFKDFGVARIKSGLPHEGVLEYTGDLNDGQRRRVLALLNEDPSYNVMLCTQAAAGLGLNLSAANYVFHFDHWWNDARTRQAEDRAHRIGQKKTVFVYHLWVKNTVEQRIYRILERKRAQFEEVIGPLSNVEGVGLSEEELFEIFGLKKARVRREVASPVGSPATGPEPASPRVPASEIPDVDVWPLIRRTELALRKRVRDVLVEHYGSGARERVLAHVGVEEALRISQTIEQYRRKHSARTDDFSPSEDPLDYTYLKQMMSVISREWQLFKSTFGDRSFIDSKLSEIAVVRNDEAHFRGIPPVEKMRAYVACSDLLAKLQPPRGGPAEAAGQ